MLLTEAERIEGLIGVALNGTKAQKKKGFSVEYFEGQEAGLKAALQIVKNIKESSPVIFKIGKRIIARLPGNNPESIIRLKLSNLASEYKTTAINVTQCGRKLF